MLGCPPGGHTRGVEQQRSIDPFPPQQRNRCEPCGRVVRGREDDAMTDSLGCGEVKRPAMDAVGLRRCSGSVRHIKGERGLLAGGHRDCRAIDASSDVGLPAMHPNERVGRGGADVKQAATCLDDRGGRLDHDVAEAVVGAGVDPEAALNQLEASLMIARPEHPDHRVARDGELAANQVGRDPGIGGPRFKGVARGEPLAFGNAVEGGACRREETRRAHTSGNANRRKPAERPGRVATRGHHDRGQQCDGHRPPVKQPSATAADGP